MVGEVHGGGSHGTSATVVVSRPVGRAVKATPAPGPPRFASRVLLDLSCTEEGSVEENLVTDALQLQIRPHVVCVALRGPPTMSSPVAVWSTLTLARQQQSDQMFQRTVAKRYTLKVSLPAEFEIFVLPGLRRMPASVNKARCNVANTVVVLSWDVTRYVSSKKASRLSPTRPFTLLELHSHLGGSRTSIFDDVSFLKLFTCEGTRQSPKKTLITYRNRTPKN